MEHTLRQIEHATKSIEALAPGLRLLDDLDVFSHGLRVAMAMAYDEPDQWRIRALRIVMGGLMAVAFPLLLQHSRWATKYWVEWGSLRERVVADHLWLTAAAVGEGQGEGTKTMMMTMIERNDVILAGYENMSLLWKDHRYEGWQPADGLMFPEKGGDDPTNLRPVPPTPDLSSLENVRKERGRKRSRAIPIMRPDGTSITLPSDEQSPLRRDQEPGKLDIPSPHKLSVSPRAQSWPRGPRPGVSGSSTAANPVENGSGYSKEREISTSHACVSSNHFPPPEGDSNIDSRPTNHGDAKSESNAAQGEAVEHEMGSQEGEFQSPNQESTHVNNT